MCLLDYSYRLTEIIFTGCFAYLRNSLLPACLQVMIAANSCRIQALDDLLHPCLWRFDAHFPISCCQTAHKTKQNRRSNSVKQQSNLGAKPAVRLLRLHDGRPDALLAGPSVALHFVEAHLLSAETCAALLWSNAAYGCRKTDNWFNDKHTTTSFPFSSLFRHW